MKTIEGKVSVNGIQLPKREEVERSIDNLTTALTNNSGANLTAADMSIAIDALQVLKVAQNMKESENAYRYKKRKVIPYHTFTKPVCRGSLLLGTACGKCEKCEWERKNK